MEQVLDVYKRPYNEQIPIICMDESPKQLIKETKTALPVRPGHPLKEDYEYERCGVTNVFLASEPLKGKRFIEITQRKTKEDWAYFIRRISEEWYPKASKIILVMDNLITHKAGALYETFEPTEAKRIKDRFEFVYTPKHGSWLNMAEIELNVLMNRCLNRRIDNMETLQKEAAAWQKYRNGKSATIWVRKKATTTAATRVAATPTIRVLEQEGIDVPPLSRSK